MALEQPYRDTAPPPGWQPKSPFFRWLWAKMDEASLAALKIPISGRVTCPNCRTAFMVSLHVAGFEERPPD